MMAKSNHACAQLRVINYFCYLHPSGFYKQLEVDFENKIAVIPSLQLSIFSRRFFLEKRSTITLVSVFCYNFV